MSRTQSFRRGSALAALLATCACAGGKGATDPRLEATGRIGAGSRCAALAQAMSSRWPEAGTRIVSADFRPTGPMPAAPGPGGPAGPDVELPAHCEIVGVMHERTGIDGQPYAIRFHLRLPESWNGRLFFQGGGGTNGALGDAIGTTGGGRAPALSDGYAVLSQDSGHDNAINTDPARGGMTAFGFDPQARADYGGASLEPVTHAAKAAIEWFYGRRPDFSYFVGCSKGGQEGMMLAQRHPDLYDGIIAAAPGMSLPRAALAEAWDTQAFASVPIAAGQPVTPASLASSFSDSDLGLVRNAVLGACDSLDGLSDGIVAAVGQCTSERVVPALDQISCSGTKTDDCLSPSQIDALRRVHDGPRNNMGAQLYPGFPWDAGWFGMGWRIWKIGAADGSIPSINVAMGAPALASIFTTPPTPLSGGLQTNLDYLIRFDFDRDAQRIDATGGAFSSSAWEDIGARSADLRGFRANGGKMIVPHGVSDPVFSVSDSIDWWKEVDRASGDQAADFVRVFPVPGMAHCGGGPATDQFDTFGALVAWVEKQRPPDRIEAAAGPMSPWPGRSRPLCPYPTTARFRGTLGDPEKSTSFSCS